MKTILPLFLLLLCFSCQQQDLPAPLPICTEEILLLNEPVICCIGLRVQKTSDNGYLRIVEFPSDVDTTGLTGTTIRVSYEMLPSLNCPAYEQGALCGASPLYDPIKVLEVCVEE